MRFLSTPTPEESADPGVYFRGREGLQVECPVVNSPLNGTSNPRKSTTRLGKCLKNKRVLEKKRRNWYSDMLPTGINFQTQTPTLSRTCGSLRRSTLSGDQSTTSSALMRLRKNRSPCRDSSLMTHRRPLRLIRICVVLSGW